MKYFILPVFLSITIVPISPASAAVTDPVIEGAKLCTRQLPRYEREYAIPTHLLSAIASTESGRYHSGLKMKLPWPWTVTTGGKGYYYDSKSEAVAAVKKFKAQGAKNIDVGCMQVNLQHHPDAFTSVENAFEPEYNVSYAAHFLRELYDASNSWKKAASDYHSKTPQHGTRYIGQVYDHWYQIIEKLREARLTVPSSAVAAMNSLKTGASGVTVKYGAAPDKKTQVAAVAEKPAYQAPRMKSIKVTSTTDNTSKETEVTGYTPVPHARPLDKGAIIVRYEPDASDTKNTQDSGRYYASLTPAGQSLPPEVANPPQALAIESLGTKAAKTDASPEIKATVALSKPETPLTELAQLQASLTAPMPQSFPSAKVEEKDDKVTEPKVIQVSGRRPVEDNMILMRRTGPSFVFAD